MEKLGKHTHTRKKLSFTLQQHPPQSEVVHFMYFIVLCLHLSFFILFYYTPVVSTLYNSAWWLVFLRTQTLHEKGEKNSEKDSFLLAWRNKKFHFSSSFLFHYLYFLSFRLDSETLFAVHCIRFGYLKGE